MPGSVVTRPGFQTSREARLRGFFHVLLMCDALGGTHEADLAHKLAKEACEAIDKLPQAVSRKTAKAAIEDYPPQARAILLQKAEQVTLAFERTAKRNRAFLKELQERAWPPSVATRLAPPPPLAAL